MSFTSRQREIVARKLGYNGPMQGFDEYLKSSPALEMRYNAVADKYTQKMAAGGVVRKKMNVGGVVTPTAGGVSDDMIRGFFMANKDNPAAIKQAAAQYGISPEKAAQALGVSLAQFNSYVAKAR